MHYIFPENSGTVSTFSVTLPAAAISYPLSKICSFHISAEKIGFTLLYQLYGYIFIEVRKLSWESFKFWGAGGEICCFFPQKINVALIVLVEKLSQIVVVPDHESMKIDSSCHGIIIYLFFYCLQPWICRKKRARN